MNALKHCLLAESVVIPDCDELESRDQFDQLLSDLTGELKPIGIVEEMLVEQIAVSYWRLRRVLRKEAGDIAGRVVHHHRWNADNPIGHASLPDLDSAHLIIRYESTIERRMNRALYTLERLQSRRKEKAKVLREAQNNPITPNNFIGTENPKLPNEPNSPQPHATHPDTEKNDPLNCG